MNITISRTNNKEGLRFIRNETSRFLDIEFKEIYKNKIDAEKAGDTKSVQHWQEVLYKRNKQIQTMGYVMDYTSIYNKTTVTVYGIEEWDSAAGWVATWR